LHSVADPENFFHSVLTMDGSKRLPKDKWKGRGTNDKHVLAIENDFARAMADLPSKLGAGRLRLLLLLLAGHHSQHLPHPRRSPGLSSPTSPFVLNLPRSLSASKLVLFLSLWHVGISIVIAAFLFRAFSDPTRLTNPPQNRCWTRPKWRTRPQLRERVRLSQARRIRQVFGFDIMAIIGSSSTTLSLTRAGRAARAGTRCSPRLPAPVRALCDREMDGWMDGWMDGCTDGWMDGWIDRYRSPLCKGHYATPDVYHRCTCRRNPLDLSLFLSLVCVRACVRSCVCVCARARQGCAHHAGGQGVL
jgi:hypothetical protein